LRQGRLGGTSFTFNGSRVAAFDLINSSQVPAAFKFSVQPGIDDADRFLFADHPLAEGDYICVIVLFGQPRAALVPANGTANAPDFVGYDRLAIPTTSQDNPQFGFPLPTLSAAGRIKSG